MDKFEYKEELVPHRIASVGAWLNGYGAEGWEAVHFYCSGMNAIVLFKRKITA